MMKYRGYVAKIDYDQQGGRMHGRVIKCADGTDCGVTFSADSVSDLGRAFQASVDDYVAWRKLRDEPPNHPIYLIAALQR